MDDATKSKWIEALRSGRYKQIKGKLRAGDGHCCLGVLAEELKMPINCDGNGIENERYRPIWAIVGEEFARSLATANDNGRSFSVIADAIQRHRFVDKKSTP